MADYITDGKIGIDLTKTYSSASAGMTDPWPAQPGDTVRASNSSLYMFARAQSTVAQYDFVAFAAFGDSAVSVSGTVWPRAVPVTTTNVSLGGIAQGCPVGIAQTAVESANYGWFALEGTRLRVKTLIAAQPNVPLFTTSTAGSLDDATVSTAYIQGLSIITSAASASAPFAIARNMQVVQWPQQS